jgi:hypothetical protein
MGSKIFGYLVAALRRLVTEKSALLGPGSQMHGVVVKYLGSGMDRMFVGWRDV